MIFFDTECYPNFWLLMFSNGQSFELREGESLNVDQILSIFNNHCVVSFNGNNYDIPMIIGALSGYTPQQLKRLNDRIIVEQTKPWELGLAEWKPKNHIDIMETAPGRAGLKKYAAMIHCKTIRDLPYDPNMTLTEEQIDNVISYCRNDITILESLYQALQPQIEQRIVLGERYGIDLRSKSDAQVAESILKHRCEQALGKRIFKSDIDWNMRFKYRAPEYLAFHHPQLQQAFEQVKSATFRFDASCKLEGIKDLTVTLNHTTYKMGLGGLHSQEERRALRSTDSHTLIDIDVAACYPFLILNSGEYPQAFGRSFLQEYKSIIDERVTIKRQIKEGGDKNRLKIIDAGLKIQLNGTFGKTGSQYSALFAPTMLIQTTITGQLNLLMLVDWFEYYNIPVVSANTDGILINCPNDKLLVADYLIEEWENRTKLTMEKSVYRAVYSRDINNYIAIKEGEAPKRKGEYAKSGLVEKKQPCVEICGDAVAAFLNDDTSIYETIALCKDIRKFVVVKEVTGGGVKMWGEGPAKGTLVRDMASTLIHHGWTQSSQRCWRRGYDAKTPQDAYLTCFQPQRKEYLGKIVRWYYSTQAPGPIVYVKSGNTVPLSNGARPCMTLPDTFPDDIDYRWYVTKCEKMLDDIGYNVIV